MTVALYRAEWDAEIASAHTPLYLEVAAGYPDLFDYSATFDAVCADPYVDAQVLPSVYLEPTVVVIDGDIETHLRLEATRAPSKAPSPADLAARVARQRVIEQ